MQGWIYSFGVPRAVKTLRLLYVIKNFGCDHSYFVVAISQNNCKETFSDLKE
jgi:hypothetical protein